MKFVKKIIGSPKRLFRYKKSSASSEEYSMSSGSTSSSQIFKSIEEYNPRSSIPFKSGSDDAELVRAIKRIDQDNDGLVSRSELEGFLAHMGFIADVEAMVREMVDEGSTMIRLEELCKKLGSVCDAPADVEEIREAFDLFDADGDGRLTAEELLDVFLSLGNDGCSLDDCRRMVTAVGKDGAHFVSFNDFVSMMMV